jgi:gamma-glutamylcyclotransferase (GGCT)/AIG2-like uncharacterized protein YtfP
MLLATYGTLRRGECRNAILENSKYIGTFVTENPFHLFNLGTFPGIHPGGNKGIVVDVYDVDHETLAYCDRIEGVPWLYNRDYALINGVKAIVYVYQHKMEGTPIPSGDWKDVSCTT